MINEQDDNPFVANDSGSSESAAANSGQVSSELSPEIFKTPNVQLFVLNDSTLMSFVELSNADTVRIIFRDISGKFSWDVTPAVAVTQWENPQSGGGHQQDQSAVQKSIPALILYLTKTIYQDRDLEKDVYHKF